MPSSVKIRETFKSANLPSPIQRLSITNRGLWLTSQISLNMQLSMGAESLYRSKSASSHDFHLNLATRTAALVHPSTTRVCPISHQVLPALRIRNKNRKILRTQPSRKWAPSCLQISPYLNVLVKNTPKSLCQLLRISFVVETPKLVLGLTKLIGRSTLKAKRRRAHLENKSVSIIVPWVFSSATIRPLSYRLTSKLCKKFQLNKALNRHTSKRWIYLTKTHPKKEVPGTRRQVSIKETENLIFLKLEDKTLVCGQKAFNCELFKLI